MIMIFTCFETHDEEDFIRILIVAILVLSCDFAVARNCDSVSRELKDAEKTAVAPILVDQLKKEMPNVKDIEVLKKFKFKKWIIYKVNSKVSDEPFMFYNGEPSAATYVGDWSGVARIQDTNEIFDWTTENMKGIPKELAKCFAWHVTKERK